MRMITDAKTIVSRLTQDHARVYGFSDLARVTPGTLKDLYSADAAVVQDSIATVTDVLRADLKKEILALGKSLPEMQTSEYPREAAQRLASRATCAGLLCGVLEGFLASTMEQAPA